MTIPKVRVRARKPKTKTGCKTCKVRRVKCDEEKPFCRRCKSSGRTCDGYERPPISSSQESQSPTFESNLIKSLSVSFSSLGLNEEEALGFDFFRQRTTHEIHGCFRSSLWENLILQISHHEPSVLHAAIAVGSIHRVQSEGKAEFTHFTNTYYPRLFLGARQYIKAIGFLRTRITDQDGPQSTQVALITCLLFICLEMIRGQRVSALVHLGTGLRILSPRKRSPLSAGNTLALKHDSEVVMDQLLSVFGRLDYESTMFGIRSPQFVLVPAHTTRIEDVSVPSSFQSVSEARQYLDILNNEVSQLRGRLLELSAHLVSSNVTSDLHTQVLQEAAMARQIDLSDHPTMLADLRRLQASLAVWSAALKDFKSKSEAVQLSEDDRALILLEIQHFLPYTTVSAFQMIKEKAYDSFNPQFRHILDLTHTYLQDVGSRGPLPLFTLESGVLPSVYSIAVKCRCPKMRREAHAILRDAKCQEGMSEGKLIQQFSMQQIILEESRAVEITGRPVKECTDVPEEARVGDIVLAASEDPTRGKLICARYRFETDGSLVVWEKEIIIQPP